MCPVTEETKLKDESQPIALALSGGGFRAALFHLGVICFLRDQGQLENIQTIAGVSGGAILAAHLALNWNNYIGDDDAFQKAVSEFIEFARLNLRNRILRRLFALGVWGIPVAVAYFRRTSIRTWLLERFYNRFYRKEQREALKPSDGPDVHILATSLTQGRLFRFSAKGMHWKANGTEKTVPGIFTVAKAVAASSAFPIFFPPIPVHPKMLNLNQEQIDDHFLSDGGFFDNLGVLGLLEIPIAPSQVYVISSDASANFDHDKSRYWNAIRRNLRASDVLMKQASNHVLKLHKGIHAVKIAEEITTTDCAQAIPATLQNTARNMRTDLNRCSKTEITVLMRHGYAVAWHQLKECRFQSIPKKLCLFKEENTSELKSDALLIDDVRLSLWNLPWELFCDFGDLCGLFWLYLSWGLWLYVLTWVLWHFFLWLD